MVLQNKLNCAKANQLLRMRRLNVRFISKSGSLSFCLNKTRVIFTCCHHSSCSVWRKASAVKQECALKVLLYFFYDLVSLFPKHTKKKKRGWWGPFKAFLMLRFNETIPKTTKAQEKVAKYYGRAKQAKRDHELSIEYKYFTRVASL